VRLHKDLKTRSEDVLNVLDVEQTVQEVALRFDAVTKGRARLVVLLLHLNVDLIGVSHSCVRCVFRKKSVDAARWPSGRPGAVSAAGPAAAKRHMSEGGLNGSDGRVVTTGWSARAGAWDGNEAVSDAKQRLSVPEESVGHDDSARALESECRCVRACNARTPSRQH